MAAKGIVTGRIYTTRDSRAPLSPRQLQDLKNIGVNYIRVDFEDRGGQDLERVQAYKNIIVNAGKIGIGVIGLVTWSGMREQVDPWNYQDINEYDREFVERYKRDLAWHDETYRNVNGYGVEGWEIWNEPDIYIFRRGNDYAADRFALLCVRVYEAFAGKIGGRKLIMGAISRMDGFVEVGKPNALQATFDSTPMRNYRSANGGRLPCVIVAIHGYGFNEHPTSGEYAWNWSRNARGGTFDDQARYFLNQRDRDGRPWIPAGVKVFMTEVGYTSDPSHSANEAHQAEALKYVMSVVDRYPQFERVYWYNYRDSEDPGEPGSFGIRRPAPLELGFGGIKPVYNALANINSRPGVGQDSPADGGGISQTFVDAFNRTDGPNNGLGHPADNGGGPYIHRWGNAWAQDFKGAIYSATGSAMITLEDGAEEAAVVYGRFYDVWIEAGGGPGIGFAFDNGGGVDRHPWNSSSGDTGLVQDLGKLEGGPRVQTGILMYETSAGRVDQVFLVTQPILGKFLAEGGVERYGYPRSKRLNDGRYYQDFARGRIYEDGAPPPPPPSQLTLEYRGYVQDSGWQGWVANGRTAGTIGQARRLEGLEIKLTGNAGSARVCYKAHVENFGWMDQHCNGETIGIPGSRLRIEAVQIWLENSPDPRGVWYRAHVENIGWMSWVANGATAGTEGQRLRIEAIEIRIGQP